MHYSNICEKPSVLLLSLDTAEPQIQGDYTYRILLPSPENYLLQMKKGSDWFTLYSFDTFHYTEADCLCGHHYSSTYPEAVFVNNLVAARKMKNEVRSLRNSSYHKISAESTEIDEIDSKETLKEILEEQFEITLRIDEIEMLYSNYCKTK